MIMFEKYDAIEKSCTLTISVGKVTLHTDEEKFARETENIVKIKGNLI